MLAPLNGASRVDIENAPLVFVGYGVDAPGARLERLQGPGHARQDPGRAGQRPRLRSRAGEPVAGKFGGKAMTYYGRWTYKFEEAARQGAAGIILIHETAPASYGWEVVQNSNTIPQFDIVRENPAGQHSPLESWIQRPLAVQLFQRSGLDFEQAKVAARNPELPADAAQGDADRRIIRRQPKVIESHNVVGILPGQDTSRTRRSSTRRTGTISASASPTRPATASTMARSTTATGIAELIEQARVFAHGPRPDRSVVFLAVTAEEKGLLGSEYYATAPALFAAARRSRTSTSTRGSRSAGRRISPSRGTAKLDLARLLIAAGKTQGRYFTPDPHPETGGFYRSRPFLLREGRRSGDQLLARVSTW